MTFIKNLIAALAIFFGFVALSASAATLSLVPKGQNFGVGQEFTVDLLMDTENVNVNAAQAIIHYPAGVLKFVSADRSKSVFNFWVEDPTASDGSLSFIGGTSENPSGHSLLIFTARFKAVGAGTANLTISDGVVTASDGRGTNVLSTTKGANIVVSTTALAPEAVPMEQPQEIVRKALPSTKLPALPKVRINSYPDPASWYSQISDVIAFWDVPVDVTQIATAVDQSDKTVPTKFDTKLFNGKNFGSLKEGVWYVHIRFKNNVGAGPAAHYRIAIDATPPLPFKIDAPEGGLLIEGAETKLKTDNPQPVLRFATADALSGISRYLVQIGNGEASKIETGEFKLPLQPPGQRTVYIKAVDRAGNTREGALNMEILPIVAPVITFITKDTFVGEGDILVRGTAMPDFIIRISLKKETGDVAAEGLAAVDKNGNWETIINQPLKAGKHYVEVTAQDARGAQSLPVKSGLFKVRERPLFTIAGIGVTQFWFFIGLILILLAGFAAGWFSYHLWRAQLQRKVVIAQRDVIAAFNLIKKDVEAALSKYADKHVDKREISEIEFTLKKIKENLDKMQKYVLENIEEISD